MAFGDPPGRPTSVEDRVLALVEASENQLLATQAAAEALQTTRADLLREQLEATNRVAGAMGAAAGRVEAQMQRAIRSFRVWAAWTVVLTFLLSAGIGFGSLWWAQSELEELRTLRQEEVKAIDAQREAWRREDARRRGQPQPR